MLAKKISVLGEASLYFKHTDMWLLLAVAHAVPPTVSQSLLNWISMNGGGGIVNIATDANGLRGLITTRAALVGDILLEVYTAA